MKCGHSVWAYVWDDDAARRVLKEAHYVRRTEHEGCVPAVLFEILINGQIVRVGAVYPSETDAREKETWT